MKKKSERVVRMDGDGRWELFIKGGAWLERHKKRWTVHKKGKKIVERVGANNVTDDEKRTGWGICRKGWGRKVKLERY